MTEKNKTPEPGEVWIHNNGISYKVLFLANDGTHPNYPVSVVYEGQNGKRWVRSLSDWHRSFSLTNNTLHVQPGREAGGL